MKLKWERRDAVFVIELSDGYEFFEYDRSDTEEESQKMWDFFLADGELAFLEMRMVFAGQVVREWKCDARSSSV